MFDKLLQLRVGEEFTPFHVTEAGGIFCHHFLAIEMVGDGGSGFIFAVYAATA